jgi:hypothetical protein
MNSAITMEFDIADADILEEIESIRLKSNGTWVGGVIKDYDSAREVGIIELEDGSEAVFSRSSVCCLKYNGGRTCVTHRRFDNTKIKGGTVVLAYTNGISTSPILIWEPKEMRYVCDAKKMYSRTRFVHEGNVVWSGFGYYLIDKDYPREDYPLSDTTRIEVFLNNNWTPLSSDPRGLEYSQCSK